MSPGNGYESWEARTRAIAEENRARRVAACPGCERLRAQLSDANEAVASLHSTVRRLWREIRVLRGLEDPK